MCCAKRMGGDAACKPLRTARMHGGPPVEAPNAMSDAACAPAGSASSVAAGSLRDEGGPSSRSRASGVSVAFWCHLVPPRRNIRCLILRSGGLRTNKKRCSLVRASAQSTPGQALRYTHNSLTARSHDKHITLPSRVNTRRSAHGPLVRGRSPRNPSASRIRHPSTTSVTRAPTHTRAHDASLTGQRPGHSGGAHAPGPNDSRRPGSTELTHRPPRLPTSRRSRTPNRARAKPTQVRSRSAGPGTLARAPSGNAKAAITVGDCRSLDARYALTPSRRLRP